MLEPFIWSKNYHEIETKMYLLSVKIDHKVLLQLRHSELAVCLWCCAISNKEVSVAGLTYIAVKSVSQSIHTQCHAWPKYFILCLIKVAAIDMERKFSIIRSSKNLVNFKH